MRSTEIIQFLNCLQGKAIIAKSSGYISCQVVINELEYVIKYEIITLQDKQTENFMVLDLRKIKEVIVDKDKINISIFINDEIETEISISKIG